MHEMNELTWVKWHERLEMKELKRMICHECNEIKELKLRNWHEGIETYDLKRMNWHEWIEMSDLTWLTWNEGMERNELWMKWMNWHEWIETNELERMNWNERFVDLIFKKCSEAESFLRFSYDQLLDDDVVDRWHEALATVARALCPPHGRPHLQKVFWGRQFLTISMWSTAWWRCGRQMKWSSRYSRARTLSTSSSPSSSKSGPRPSVFDDFMLNRALATVSCTFCRPQLQKCKKPAVFLTLFFVKSSSRQSVVHILSTSTSKSGKNCSFFTIFIWNLALASVSCASVDHFPDRGAQPRKQTPSSGDRGQPHYPVFCPRVFSAVNSHVPDRSHFRTKLPLNNNRNNDNNSI